MARVVILVFLVITRVAGSQCAYAHETQSRPGTQPRSDTQKSDAAVRYVLVGSILVLGSAAAILESQSDREYSRYLETAHPERMHEYYDRAERYRDLSNGALIAAEACAVGLVVHVLRAESKAEPRPEGVRITLEVNPPRAEVSLRW